MRHGRSGHMFLNIAALSKRKKQKSACLTPLLTIKAPPCGGMATLNIEIRSMGRWLTILGALTDRGTQSHLTYPEVPISRSRQNKRSPTV